MPTLVCETLQQRVHLRALLVAKGVEISYSHLLPASFLQPHESIQEPTFLVVGKFILLPVEENLEVQGLFDKLRTMGCLSCGG